MPVNDFLFYMGLAATFFALVGWKMHSNRKLRKKLLLEELIKLGFKSIEPEELKDVPAVMNHVRTVGCYEADRVTLAFSRENENKAVDYFN